MLARTIRDLETKPSMLQSASILKAKNKSKSSSMAVLSLTSLVDVFTIFVIYLLVNTSETQTIIQADDKIKLPSASQTTIVDSGVVIKVINGSYYIDEKAFTSSNIARELDQRLRNLRAEKGEETPGELVIQADQNSPYDQINPLMIAGSEAGYTKIKMAALSEDKK
jgi:biopolymer transport protein ExbD